MSSGPLGIVELGAVCARMRALNLDLFGELGEWVTAADLGHQRWYATACHRHAWHADLWAQRSPTIPPLDLDRAVADARRTRLPAIPDATAYRALVTSTLAELETVARRIDPDLDPGTQRVLTLVGHDLTDLRLTGGDQRRLAKLRTIGRRGPIDGTSPCGGQ